MSKKNKKSEVVVVRDDPMPIVQSSGQAPISTRVDQSFWPKDKPLPTTYPKPAITPCQKCLRLRRDDGRQAVVQKARSHSISYFRCRVCNHSFKLASQ